MPFVSVLGEETPVFLGEDLLAWLVLAIGAAMAVGSIMAIVRPPDRPKEGDLAQAPVTRSVVMAVVGTLAAIWALASLVS
jgi:multisubunit Na+/H+ antiporter MnhG subunit